MLTIILSLLIITFGLTSYFIIWPALKRALAQIPLFYVEIQENYAKLITKDSRLLKTLCAPTTQILPDFQALSLTKPTIKIVANGLQWLGCPWQGYDVYRYYETSEDELNPNCLPKSSIYLGDQPLDYPEVSHRIAEGATLISDLVVYVRTVDPEKSLLAVRHRKEAIRQKIEGVWREILAEFQIFQGGNIQNRKSKFGINPEVFKNARKKLEIYIGLRRGSIPQKFLDNQSRSLVSAIKEDWGQKIIEIKVENFRFNEDVEKRLSEVVEARAKALARIEEAEGAKTAEQKQGEGIVAQLKLIAEEIQAQAAGLDENARVALAAKLIIERGYQDAVKQIDNAYLIDGLRGILGGNENWINVLLGRLNTP